MIAERPRFACGLLAFREEEIDDLFYIIMIAKQVQSSRVGPYFAWPDATLKTTLPRDDEITPVIWKCKALKHLNGLMPYEAKQSRRLRNPLRKA